MSRPALVFDLDGTLVDSAPDLTHAINAVLDDAGRAPLTVLQVRGLVGEGARRLVERAFAVTGEPLAPEHLERCYRAFLDRYTTVLARDSAVFPGVREGLAGLARSGWALGLCTNKPWRHTDALLHHLDLARFFEAAVGGDSLPTKKPDPAPLHEVASRLGVSRFVFVGDGPVDVEAARNAHVPLIVVTWGYSGGPPRDLDADRHVDRFDEIASAAAELLGAPAPGGG